jgi:predicted nucleic acid-binding protein
VRFWDASALVPLLVLQPATQSLSSLRSSDPEIVVWWGTAVECASAVARLKRISLLADAARALSTLKQLEQSWIEVEPSETIRTVARELLAKHELTSGDAFQLAAALQGPTAGDRLLEFVCIDRRLRRGAAGEGFTLLPAR